MKKIIILNSRNIYGGTIVLSLLGKLLTEKGFEAKVLYVHDFPSVYTKEWRFWLKWLIYAIKHRVKEVLYLFFKNTSLESLPFFSCFQYVPIKDVKEKYLPFYNRNNTIVIYPEVVSGNILRAKQVVRWLLYYHNWKDKKNAYGVDDLVICYRKKFNDWILNPHGYELKLNFFDREMYRQYNFEERTGNCYILRKGAGRKDLPKEFDGPVIDYGMSEKEIVRIFNNSKYCYSYDTHTFYVRIAAVCGCVPIVILEPGKRKSDYLSELEINIEGVAYGNTKEEIERAIATRHNLLESLDYSNKNDSNIENFIELLKERFV